MQCSSWRVAAVSFALSSALLIETPLLAAPTIEDAKLWVAEGDKAQDLGDCKTAVSKYRQALGVKETAQIYVRIGACQETDGQLADALQSYRAAKPLANEKTGPVVDEKISALTPRVPGLTFVVPADKPPEMRIEVNGVLSDLTRETLVNPGAVTIVATATGMQAFNKTVNVAPGEHQRVDIVFTPAPDEPPHDPPETPGPKPSIPGIILGAVGVAGIGVGIGLVVHGFGVESDLIDACGPAKPTFDCTGPNEAEKLDGPPQGYVDRSNAFKGGGWAALGIGAAAATVGGVLIGLSLAAKSPSPPVAVYPLIGERAFGVGALHHF